MDFTLLIIGADANAYYMARCYHEKYNKKAYLIAKNPIWFTNLSKITINKYYENIWEEQEFLKILDEFYLEHKDEKILLVSSTENYIELISKNREYLENKFYFNYPDKEIIDSLINKEEFYKKYMNNGIIDLPKTIYYDLRHNEKLNIDFSYPIIVKPANVVMYRHMDFIGKNKIYKVETEDELIKIIDNIRLGGYRDTLIIQEYIEGDDSSLFDSVVYASKDKKVKRITLAQIGLQEHTKELVGNAAVLINGYNEFNNSEEIIEKVRLLSEKIGITGFAEFDLKYDKKDNKFKLLEINPRQGRSSYYLTTAGCNLIEILYKDLILKEDINYEVLQKQVLLSFVPKKIIKNYIVNDKFRKKALSLYKKHVNPIDYKKDKNLKRDYLLYKKNKRYYSDYKNAYWKNK